MGIVWQDLRYSLRMLRKKPGFTAVAVMTLALGIGANSAIFSVVNAVMLSPLPYQNPDRLVFVSKVMSGLTVGSTDQEFAEWQARNQVFEQMTAAAGKEFDFAGGNEPERIFGLRVYANFLPLLGSQLARGRAISPEEQQPGRQQVAIISDGLWQRRFAKDEAIVGKTLLLDAESYTVIGVLSADFQSPFGSPSSPDVLVPLVPDSRNGYYLNVLGRLKANATLAQAQANMKVIFESMKSKDSSYGILAMPLREQMVKQSKLTLLILSGAVVFVLLIACANVANLLLARAAGRQTEMAIRLAVGASRTRLLRQLFTESLLLSIIGACCGLLLALWGRDFLVSLMADWMPRAQQIKLDLRVLTFTAMVAMLAGVIFGLAPALASSQPNLNEALKEGGQQHSGSRQRNRLRSLLVVSEVALALVLLIGAGLLIRSLSRLHEIKLGFDTKNVLTMRLSLPRTKYNNGQPITEFYQQVVDKVRALPGVESAGLVDTLPLTDEDSTSRFIAEGHASASSALQASGHSVSEDYFRSMGITVRIGRDLSVQDDKTAPAVAVINETMAKRLWPHETAVGQRLRPAGTNRSIEVVGVVADVRNSLLMSPQPEIYFSYRQSPRRTAFLTVRAATPSNLIAAIRKEVLAVDKDQPVYNIKTMEQRFADTTRLQRFPMVLLIFFSSLALILAVAGIYGVVSYLVAQRTHEIGVRIALGAQPQDIFKLVIGHGLMLTVIGVSVGLAGAWAVTRVMSNLLFGVSTTDPATYALLSFILLAVAVTACLVPARRATKVDPMVALRYE